MSGFFSIPKDLVKQADEQTVGFVGLPSKVYNAKILAAYIVNSQNSDSRAFTIKYQVEGNDRVFYESMWYQESRGLNTYANKKTGEEVLLPAFTQMLDCFAAAGVDINSVSPESLIVEHFGTEGTYPVFKDFTGKVMRLGIRHLLKDHYANTTDVDDTQTIQLFISDDGKSGGEIRGAKNAYSVESWEKMIAKKPDLDQRKDSKGTGAASAAPASDEKPAVQTW